MSSSDFPLMFFLVAEKFQDRAIKCNCLFICKKVEFSNLTVALWVKKWCFHMNLHVLAMTSVWCALFWKKLLHSHCVYATHTPTKAEQESERASMLTFMKLPLCCGCSRHTRSLLPLYGISNMSKASASGTASSTASSQIRVTSAAFHMGMPIPFTLLHDVTAW